MERFNAGPVSKKMASMSGKSQPCSNEVLWDSVFKGARFAIHTYRRVMSKQVLFFLVAKALLLTHLQIIYP